MDTMPTVELLEQRHSFPGHFLFKVIGSASDGFVGHAIVAVREALDRDEDPPFRLRQTRSGRHVAISFEPFVDEATQVIAVYERLRRLPGLVMLL